MRMSWSSRSRLATTRPRSLGSAHSNIERFSTDDHFTASSTCCPSGLQYCFGGPLHPWDFSSFCLEFYLRSSCARSGCWSCCSLLSLFCATKSACFGQKLEFSSKLQALWSFAYRGALELCSYGKNPRSSFGSHSAPSWDDDPSTCYHDVSHESQSWHKSSVVASRWWLG